MDLYTQTPLPADLLLSTRCPYHRPLALRRSRFFGLYHTSLHVTFLYLRFFLYCAPFACFSWTFERTGLTYVNRVVPVLG